jgi:hypothetical protein
MKDIKDIKEKVETLITSQEDIKTLHEDFKKSHEFIQKERKLFLFLSVVVVGVILIGILFFGWLFWNGSLKTMLRARTLAVQVEEISTSVEYKMILDETRAIVDGIDLTRSSLEKKQKPILESTDMEDYVTELLRNKQSGDLPDWEWFRANTVAESEMNPKAYSSAKAYGLNQLMKPTAMWVADSMLSIFGDVDLWNVRLNTKIAIRYWVFIRRYLAKNIGRQPTPIEISWAYNVGHTAALRAINSGDPENFLPKETLDHGKKVKYYKENYSKRNYKVWYYDYQYKGIPNVQTN